jgi:hypothetical protein
MLPNVIGGTMLGCSVLILPANLLIPASDSNVCDRTLDLQRPADYVVGRHVEQKLPEIGEAEGSGKQLSAAE